MVEVQEPILVDRGKDYVADEILLLNYVVSDYSQPIAPEPKEYAETEYAKQTSALCDRMRAKLSVEAMNKGLTGKEKGNFINLEIDKLKKERIDQRIQVVKNREKELAKEISEGLKNLKKLSSLETTIDDGKQIQDFAIRVLDVHPENINLLATHADANQIIKHFRVGDEE